MNRLHGLNKLAMISAFLALFTIGCTHNLQRPYVESMEATRKAIVADVDAGLYKPDARSDATLAEWKAANVDAFKLLIESEKGEGE